MAGGEGRETAGGGRQEGEFQDERVAGMATQIGRCDWIRDAHLSQCGLRRQTLRRADKLDVQQVREGRKFVYKCFKMLWSKNRWL